MSICRDRLFRLLRYGRKNGGAWDAGECDCPEDAGCEMLDDGDTDTIINAIEAADGLRADNDALRARVSELTQCDPSWYDMSVADAFRLWKADREELESVRAENERLANESKQCHARNDELVSEHISLRAEVERLKG